MWHCPKENYLHTKLTSLFFGESSGQEILGEWCSFVCREGRREGQLQAPICAAANERNAAALTCPPDPRSSNYKLWIFPQPGGECFIYFLLLAIKPTVGVRPIFVFVRWYSWFFFLFWTSREWKKEKSPHHHNFHILISNKALLSTEICGREAVGFSGKD